MDARCVEGQPEAPASALVAWAWHHLGALVVGSGGALLAAGALIAHIAGIVSESRRASLSDDPRGFLLVFALPMLLTGSYYAVRVPDGSPSDAPVV